MSISAWVCVCVCVMQPFCDEIFFPTRLNEWENDSMGNLQSIFASVFLVRSGCSIYQRLWNETRAFFFLFLVFHLALVFASFQTSIHRLEFCVHKVDAIIDSALKYAFAVFGIKHNLNKSLAYGRRTPSLSFFSSFGCSTSSNSLAPFSGDEKTRTHSLYFSILSFLYFYPLRVHILFLSLLQMNLHISHWYVLISHTICNIGVVVARPYDFFIVRDWVYSTLSLCYHLRLANFVPRHWSLGR